MEAFAAKAIDLLVADLRLPDIDGMEIIKMVKEKQPETEVVVITGYSTVSSAVDAMKIGVFDYLPKPFTESEIKIAISEALKKKKAADTPQDRGPRFDRSGQTDPETRDDPGAEPDGRR